MVRTSWTALKTAAVVAFQTAQLLSAVLTIFGVSVVASAAAAFAKSPLAPGLAGLAVGVLLVAGIMAAAYARGLRLLSTATGYETLSYRASYTICEDDHRRHVAVRTLMIRAVRPGVSVVEGRYQWTGRGDDRDIRALSPGQQLLGRPISRDAWEYYYVHLGRQLAVGEEIEVKVEQQLYDREGRFDAYLSKSVNEHLECVCLDVILPTAWRSSGCDLLEIDLATDKVLARHEIAVDATTGQVKWEICRPKIGRRYVIRWKMSTAGGNSADLVAS